MWQYWLDLQGASQGQTCFAQGNILADCVNTNSSAMCYVGNTTMERCMPGDYETGSAILGECSVISCKGNAAAPWPGISHTAPFLCVRYWEAGLRHSFGRTTCLLSASCVRHMSPCRANVLLLHEELCRADDTISAGAIRADARQGASLHCVCIILSSVALVAHLGDALQLPAMQSRTSGDITAASSLRPSSAPWLRSHSSSS